MLVLDYDIVHYRISNFYFFKEHVCVPNKLIIARKTRHVNKVFFYFFILCYSVIRRASTSSETHMLSPAELDLSTVTLLSRLLVPVYP